MLTFNMDHSSSNLTSMADSNASLPGYESQSSHTYHSDRDRGSRSSSVARSDVNSEASRYNKVKKPINEVVTTAFDEASQQHSIPPELLNQITSQVTAVVLQQLKANNIPPTATTTAQPITVPQDTHDTSSSLAGSPPLDRSQVYTPPSPQRSTAASKQTSPTYSSFSTGMARPTSPPSTTRGVSPHGTTSQSDDSDGKEAKSSRPCAPLRTSTDGDATTLEKCWGKLFENEQPTPRMNQFLRGIAMHIIEDYEPKHSLVITPEKLQRYYRETKVANEFYPWSDIFDDRTSSISRMFREFRIQHYLTQGSLSERPDVPALTPQGFAAWMTLIFLTDPEPEFERLAYTALHMPISNPDDRKERFPKEISRRMFPKEGNKLLAVGLARSMRTHCHVKLSPRTNSSSESDSRPAVADRTSRLPPPPVTSAGHRHSYADPGPTMKPRNSNSRRASYTGRSPGPSTRENSNDIIVDDTAEPAVVPKPIERERKPYVAQPGGGKNYDQVDGVPASKPQLQPQPSQPSQVPQLQPPTDAKIKRSLSVNSNARPSETSSRYVPVAVHQQSASASELPNQEQMPRHRSGSFAGTQSRSIRNRSPSATRSNPRNSENEVKSGSYYNGGSTAATYQWRDPRYDREHRASFSDQRDRGREARPRFQSSSNADSHRYYANEEDYYRQTAPAHVQDPAGYSAYPPNSFRTKQ